MRGPRRRWPPSRPRAGDSPPCVYRGFCRIGCSTNAKQSQLITFIPRAIGAGAEIRDLAMVGRIEMGADGRAYRRALPSRGEMAVPAGAQRGRRRIRDRDAAPAAALRQRPLPGRARQQLRPGRPISDDAIQPGGLGLHGRAGPVVQGAALDLDLRALELRRRQGFLRRLLLDGARPAAARMGLGADGRQGAVGRGAPSRDDPLQPPGRAQDGRRDAAEPREHGDAGRRGGPIRAAHPPHHLSLVRQRQGADPAFARPDAEEPRGGRRQATSSARRTTPTISPARPGWASTPRAASWTPTAEAGTSPTCSSAMAPSSPPRAA